VAAGAARAVAIKRLLGYDGQQTSQPFLGQSNINLAYPYAEQPMICETRASVARRCLASISLVRPAAFDPAVEFDGIGVTALAGEVFQVALPGGGLAFVAVGDELPSAVTLGGVAFSGPAIRHAALGSGLQNAAGVGVTEVAGVARCEQPACLRLMRTEGAVQGTTDSGVTLASSWLGGSLASVALRAPDGVWHDVSERCCENYLPGEVVHEWAGRTQRSLVEFRMGR
jgi:hypothetical protein